MCDNVLDLTLLYVKPTDLMPFFISHELDLSRKFKYKTDEFVHDYMLRIFHKMIFKQVNFCYIDDNKRDEQHPPNMNHKVSDTLMNSSDTIKVHNLKYENVQQILNKSVNVKKFVFEDIIMPDCSVNQNQTKTINYFTKCKNVKSIIFANCGWQFNHNYCFLLECTKLKKLTFTCFLDHNNMKIIEQCKNLKTLSIAGLTNISPNASYTITKLRKLYITNSFSTKLLNINSLHSCNNLREIRIMKCNFNFEQLDFSGFRKLEMVVFVKCNRLEGFGFNFERCKRLKCVKFIECYDMDENFKQWIKHLQNYYRVVLKN